MIKKEKILIWTTCDKSLFCRKHELNKNSYQIKDKFKNIKFTNFNVDEEDLVDEGWNYSTILKKYGLSKKLWEKLKVESISHYEVIIFDLKCLLLLKVNENQKHFPSISFVKDVLLDLIEKNKDKTFLILNAGLNDNLDNIFRANTLFNLLNLQKKRSAEIQPINQTNIDGKVVSHYYLNDREIKKDKNIKKYRPLWHAIGNKNEITGFQIDNMYFLPFGCNAMPSILENINSLLGHSNKFDEEKIFDLLKTKDPDSSLKDLPVINDFWKKHSKKEELMKNFSESQQELTDHTLKVALLLKLLEYTGENLEEIIKTNLKNFKFEILPQNKKNKDQADIIFSFNYNQSKYITLVEAKGYKDNIIDRKPFSQLPIWENEFINENPNVKFDKMIKLIVINNGYKSNESTNYDQRILKIPENIKKHYGYKDIDSPDDEIVDDIKVITTLNLVKILYSDEEHGAELLKKKLVSTKEMQIKSN